MESRYRLPSIRSPIGRLTGRTVELPPKQRADHYATPEHLAWRRAIIARAGGMCERCGRANVRLFADHVRELRDGGDPLDLANGQALCGRCHTEKTNTARANRYGV